ncbi:MAG TPA: gliding motility-associated ABC transporter permease subunit GldF [Bacteroidales bacterium]|nr:gliding motility-associated ABC transporter permease subunit GldF [Bacteroidales bacterium]HRZ50109.1 gliding motility-associated ABC transporter permease subunit GldF [Bacteroidales bacterium]
MFRKEVSGFLSSLIGYIVIAVFLLINGLFIWIFPMEFNILQYGYATLDGLFVIAPFVFLFLIPAITMRLFADERRSGTMELLLTKPVSDLQIILSKYLAGVVLVVIAILPTLVYVIAVWQLGLEPGNLDKGGTLGSYLGLLFLSAAFVAAGIFASSLTDNQIVAFILAVFLCGFSYIGFESIHNLELFGRFDLFIKALGINAHYISMSRGVIDTRDLVYFLSYIVFFLMLTRLTLQRRYW